MKYFAYLSLIVLLSNCSSTIYLSNDFYSTGQPKYKGKYIKCTSNDPIHPQITVYEERKFGEWVSYYSNGNPKEVRHYTKKVRDCQTEILKEGIWRYYNPYGILYLTEQYQNDTLIHSELDIYEDRNLIGKMIKSDLSDDSVIMYMPPSTKQLIANADFDQYYFKPVFMANDGHNQIESLIPSWYSPDKATPDYYNSYRFVQNVPPHFPKQKNPATNNGYVGLMLFVGTGNNRRFNPPDYTETLQTKLLEPLQKDKTYCIKIRIRLSDNSAYSINKLGVLFSKEAMTFNNTTSLDSTSISFTQELGNQKSWKTLCSNYLANGGERYMTIGRFASSSRLIKELSYFEYKSPLNINESAYYLVDNVELYVVSDSTECFCENIDYLSDSEVDIFTIGETIILNNILFKFDSYELNPRSYNELGQLKEYMQTTLEIIIEITGHTDNVGSDEYNLQLSQQRADEVRIWLVKNGINTDRILTKGAGNKYPIDRNSLNSDMNRRVEIILTLK